VCVCGVVEEDQQEVPKDTLVNLSLDLIQVPLAGGNKVEYTPYIVRVSGGTRT